MLLDEPTNHLDMRAKDVLLTALQKYNGTVVFVSHDRYFIDRLATRVIEVENGQVHSWSGELRGLPVAEDRADPRSWRWPAPRRPRRRRNPQYPRPASGEAAPEASVESATLSRSRLNPIKLRQMKERRRAIEDEVTRLEVEIADYEGALGNFSSAEETQRLTGLLEARRADLESLLAEWEEVANTIEANS